MTKLKPLLLVRPASVLAIAHSRDVVPIEDDLDLATEQLVHVGVAPVLGAELALVDAFASGAAEGEGDGHGRLQ